MKCPHDLSFANNEELFTEHDVPDEVRAHVEQCEACQHDICVHEKVQNMLVAALYRKECPASSVLSAYAANMLPENEQLPVQLHLRVCPLCMMEVEDVRDLFNDTEGLL